MTLISSSGPDLQAAIQIAVDSVAHSVSESNFLNSRPQLGATPIQSVGATPIQSEDAEAATEAFKTFLNVADSFGITPDAAMGMYQTHSKAEV